MKKYLELLEKTIESNTNKGQAREEMPETLSIFGPSMEFDLSDGFPIVTTKNVNFKNIVVELLWILKGDSNIRYLVENGVNIWNEDAYNYYALRCKRTGVSPSSKEAFTRALLLGSNVSEKINMPPVVNSYKLGDTGAQYPKLWRNIDGNDQLYNLIYNIAKNKNSRRLIIDSINVPTIYDMALYPCHVLFQLYYRESPDDGYGYFDSLMYQRSADSILGVPYNTASYAMFTTLLCEIFGVKPGIFKHVFGDFHIYSKHIDAAKEQIKREPYKLPSISISKNVREAFQKLRSDLSESILRSEQLPYEDTSIEDFAKKVIKIIELLKPTDFRLLNYESHGKLENETKLFTGTGS